MRHKMAVFDLGLSHLRVGYLHELGNSSSFSVGLRLLHGEMQ
jgi:hypothetical protein